MRLSRKTGGGDNQVYHDNWTTENNNLLTFNIPYFFRMCYQDIWLMYFSPRYNLHLIKRLLTARAGADCGK